jgi:hypothetical protein
LNSCSCMVETIFFPPLSSHSTFGNLGSEKVSKNGTKYQVHRIYYLQTYDRCLRRIPIPSPGSH